MSFYVVFDENDPLIIAPVFVKKKIVTVAGTDEFFDYVDLFYRGDIKKERLKDAFESLMFFLVSMEHLLLDGIMFQRNQFPESFC